MESRNGKYKPINFWQNNLEVSRYEITDGKPQIEIKYDGKVIFSHFKPIPKTPEKPIPKKDIDVSSFKEDEKDPIWKLLDVAWREVGDKRGLEIKGNARLIGKVYKIKDAETLYDLLQKEIKANSEEDVPF